MELNLDLIRHRFQDIQQSVERLERIRSIPRDEFLADQDILDVAAYRLLVAIEASLGVCFHVCARRLNCVPDDYAGCFAALSEAGLLPEDLSQNLQRMARFRNKLVHGYWKIDYDRVHDILSTHLGDLRSFVNAIGDLL